MNTGTIKLNSFKKDDSLECHSVDSTGFIKLNEKAIEEFFNKCHDAQGRFCGGSGGKGAKEQSKGLDRETEKKVISITSKGPNANALGAASISARAKRNATIKKVAIGLGVVAIAAGLIYLGAPIAAKAGITAETTEAVEIAKTAKGYSTIAKDGRTLHVIDHTGRLKENQAQSLLTHLNAAHERSPLPGKPPRIEVRSIPEIEFDAFVKTKKGTRTIHVNENSFFNHEARDRNLKLLDETYKKLGLKDKYFMPSYYRGSANRVKERSIIFHEYGHLHEIERMPLLINSENGRASSSAAYDQISERVHERASKNGLSIYGQYDSNRINHLREGYAEAFSEYFSTNGRTRNQAAKIYAEEYGWTISG